MTVPLKLKYKKLKNKITKIQTKTNYSKQPRAEQPAAN
jgi:hypothetical protein